MNKQPAPSGDAGKAAVSPQDKDELYDAAVEVGILWAMRNAAGRTIVIAEDSRLPAMILIRALESRGHAVHWGANGALALALVREHRPATLISGTSPC